MKIVFIPEGEEGFKRDAAEAEGALAILQNTAEDGKKGTLTSLRGYGRLDPSVVAVTLISAAIKDDTEDSFLRELINCIGALWTQLEGDDEDEDDEDDEDDNDDEDDEDDEGDEDDDGGETLDEAFQAVVREWRENRETD